MPNALDYASPSPEHLAQLDAARVASKKIRRVVAVANFDGWSIAAFGAISLVFSLTSPSGLILGLGMGYIAYTELSSAAALKKLQPGVCRKLAINQLVFSALLILYFAWGLYDSLSTQLPAEAVDAGISPDMIHQLTIIAYAGLIVLSLLFQGGTAWYYASRAKVIDTYLAATPQWIIDYQRGGGTL